MTSSSRQAWEVTESAYPRDGSPRERLAFLVRYAVLAPSSHNSQPWTFTVDDAGIDAAVDRDRWLRVADATQRELYISLGCALENLVTAAAWFGLAATVGEIDHGRVRVTFAPATDHPPTAVAQRFAAITTRRTNRGRFDRAPVDGMVLSSLEALCEPHVHAFLSSDAELRRIADELIARADAVQFADASWREELSYWLGHGAFGQSWLIAKLAWLAVRHLDLHGSTARRDHDILMSAPVLGLLTTPTADAEDRVATGRALQRLWLAAESVGLRLHPMNQVLQVPELELELRERLGLGLQVPQLMFRLGYAPAEHTHSPRRPLEDVLR